MHLRVSRNEAMMKDFLQSAGAASLALGLARADHGPAEEQAEHDSRAKAAECRVHPRRRSSL